YLDLAKCYMKLNQPATAIEVLNAGIHKRGELAVFNDRIVDIYLAQKHYSDALAHLEKIIAIGQRLPFLYVQKAEILLLQDRKQDAYDSLQLALSQIHSLPESRRQ